MRLLFIAFLVLLPSSPPAQTPKEGGLEDVLKLMEKRAEGLKDVSFSVTTKATQSMGMSADVDVIVRYVKGSGLRVHATSRPRKGPVRAGMKPPSRADFIYTDEAFYEVIEWDSAPTSAFLPRQAYKARYDDPGLKRFDLYYLPHGIPLRMVMDDPLVYYMLDPRLFFGREPHLAYEGKRQMGKVTYHVLSSTPEPESSEPEANGMSFLPRRKEFFIDAASGALRHLRTEMSIRMNLGGRVQEQKMVFRSKTAGAQALTPTLTLPDSVTMSIEMKDMPRGMVRGSSQQLVRRLRGIRANAGLAAEVIIRDWERSDLYADLVLDTTEKYEALLGKNPDDARAHFNLAHARGGLSRLLPVMPGGAVNKGSGEEMLRDLEKAASLRPRARGVWLSLLAAYRTMKKEELEKALLARIERGDLEGEVIRLRAAVRLSRLGEFERAENLHSKLEPRREEDLREVALERIFVAAGRKDEEGLSKRFADEAARRTTTADKIAFVRELEVRWEALPEKAGKNLLSEWLAGFVEREAKKRPEELAYPLARAALLRNAMRPIEGSIGLLESAPTDEKAVAFALEGLDPKSDTPEKAALPKLADALGKVKSQNPRVPYVAGLALKAAGHATEARERFSAALEACREHPPGEAYHGEALRIAFEVAGESGPEGWELRCAKVILAVGRKSAEIPFNLVYDQKKNPLSKLRNEYIGRKEWMKFYRLMVDGRHLTGFLTQAQMEFREASGGKKECLDAIKRKIYQEKDPEKYLELVGFLEQMGWREEMPEALEKAWDLTPEKVSVLSRLATSLAETGNHRKAAEAYRKLIPRLEGTLKREAQVGLADAYLATDEPDKVRTVLQEISLREIRNGVLAERIATLYGKAEDWGRAIEACRRAYALGRRPHFKMGRFYENKKDYLEAIRYYNRDIADPSAGRDPGRVKMAPPPPVAPVPAPAPPGRAPAKREPRNGKEAKEILLEKLGPWWLVKKLLEREPEPLPANVERKVKEHLRDLSSESIVERDDAFEALRRHGPKVAPLLKPLLDAGDDEVKARIRQLLQEWAEPK